MRGEVTCGRLRANWPHLLLADPDQVETAEIRRHLTDCASCRAAVGEYFPVDLWEERALPTSRVSPSFTARVLAELGPGAAVDVPVGAERTMAGPKSAPAMYPALRRSQVLWNFLSTAAVTLVLVFLGYFGVLAEMGRPAVRLDQSIRAACLRTRRLIETETDWLAIWRRLDSVARETHGKGGQ